MINRRLILLFLLLMFCSFLMTFQSTRGPLRIFAAIQIPLYHLDRYAMSIWKDITTPVLRYYRLKKENEIIKGEVKRLKLKEEENRELLHENQRLLKLLNMERVYPNFVTTAQVISSGIRQWPRILIIDKGSSEGVEKDMSVRNTEGLVGKVTEVFPDFSKVLLITDVNFSASVRLQDTRMEGVISGKGDGLCLLKYIPLEEDIHEGELLITSGLDRLYPEGIPVGYITRIKKGDALFHQIVVEPIIKTNRLEEVMVFER